MQFCTPEAWHLEAPEATAQYTGPIVLLTCDAVFSGGEAFTLAIKQLPHVTIIGRWCHQWHIGLRAGRRATEWLGSIACPTKCTCPPTWSATKAKVCHPHRSAQYEGRHRQRLRSSHYPCTGSVQVAEGRVRDERPARLGITHVQSAFQLLSSVDDANPDPTSGTARVCAYDEEEECRAARRPKTLHQRWSSTHRDIAAVLSKSVLSTARGFFVSLCSVLVGRGHSAFNLAFVWMSLRIPTKPAVHSNLKPATRSDLKPATEAGELCVNLGDDG